jgi:Na+(H+)/acetate symporter ActP
MRYYTVPSVKEARESVSWSLFFIFLLYFTAPALAVLVKYEMFTWWSARRSTSCRSGSSWSKVDPALLSVTDVNKDGILQLNEMKHRRRHHRAGHAGDRGCPTWSRAWWPRAAWLRRCPRPTGCC